MTLTLEITDSSEANPTDATRHVFGEDGGSIGRAAGNSWVLRHNKVSGLHARITFRNGVFYIEDSSRNGISLNSPDNRLGRGRPYALKAGDRILIEPYAIDVWIEDTSPRRAHAPIIDPFADEDPFAPRYDPRSSQNEAAMPAPVNEEVDPLKFFDPVGGRAPRKSEPVVVPSDDFLGSHYEPPSIVPSPVLPPPRSTPDPVAIPQGYDPLSPDEPIVQPLPPPSFPPSPSPLPAPPLAVPPPPPPPLAAPPVPAPPPIRPVPGDVPARRKARENSSSSSLSPSDSTVRQPVAPPIVPAAAAPEIEIPPPAAVPPRVETTPPPASHSADLAELLAGAGVPEAAITPELSRSLGHILRIVVSGLMDVLKSRQRIKEEFRMQQTMFRPADNNPLKFSANLDDALHNLLVKRNAAYLSPVEAFADAFDDLRDHELAMLAGMRVAFETMLADFDPDKLQEEFDAQMGKHSLPLLPAKLRYWDLYRDRRHALAKDPEATFARLFGEEFSRAYEEQFRKLKATRRTRNQPLPDGQPPTK